jgi:hypothetical protein
VATKRWILCIFTILSSLTVLARGDNPVPVLQQLSSTAGPGGSPTFALQLYGSNFVSNSVVRWNGHNRVTTYGGPNQLTATILQADLLSIGDNLVTVFNPAPGGGESAPQPFTTFVSLMANDLVYNPRHYCPAKFSSSRPNSLKIRPITHSRSRNDLNWKEAGLTSSAGLRGETMTGELWTHRLLATDPTSP